MARATTDNDPYYSDEIARSQRKSVDAAESQVGQSVGTQHARHGSKPKANPKSARTESMQPADDPGFAEDLTDGRPKGEWRSAYPKAARDSIRLEAIVLIGYGVAGGGLLAWSLAAGGPAEGGTTADDTMARYGIAAVAGALGGTAFSLKWLYHSVAKMTWHLDRRLWRYMTPAISSIVAVLVTATIRSGLFGVFDSSALSWPSGFLAIGGLVGYFSDLAIGKLSEVAQTLFGTERSRR